MMLDDWALTLDASRTCFLHIDPVLGLFGWFQPVPTVAFASTDVKLMYPTEYHQHSPILGPKCQYTHYPTGPHKPIDRHLR